MKTLAFFISASLVLFSALINVVIAQGYVNTCSNVTFSGSILKYTCIADNGQPNTSGSDLDLCITNNNGNLQESIKLIYPNTAFNAAVARYILKDIPIYSGQFSATCNNCGLQGESDLSCTCEEISGGQVTSTIDLGWFFNTLDFLNHCIAS